jgi:hypothetical protein
MDHVLRVVRGVRRSASARAAIACSAIAVLCCAGAPPASSAAVSESDWLGRINEIRAGAQLPPVTEEPAWSAGILAHLEYLAKTPQSFDTGAYQSAHIENPASPFYTEAGAKEGDSSDLTFGAHSNLEAIDTWLAVPFHAIGMLRPGLQKVAFARSPETGDAGLDVISGLTYGMTEPRQVLYPGPGSTIDLPFYLGEEPSPIETCIAQHPGADYSRTGLPAIALLTEPPSPELSATMTRPDGSKVSSTGPELCIVTEHNFVTKDQIYGPTGSDILSSDNAVFVIPREHLAEGEYSIDISQPGRPDVSWSFHSKPKPEPVTRDFELEVLVHGAKARFRSIKALLGQRVTVSVYRQWVPCAIVLSSSTCTWVPKGPPVHRTLKLSRSSVVNFRPPGPWEKVLINAKAKQLVAGLTTYPAATALTIVRGPKPHHAAH